MDINAIWAMLEPYVTGIAGTATGGLIVGIICRLLQGRLMRRLDAGALADKVAQKLGGKTFNVDMTAVAEKKLDKIDRKLSKKVEDIQEQTAAYKHLLVLIGGAISKLKAVTEQEKASFTEAIRALERSYIPPEPEEIITVKLEPIVFEDKTEEAEETGLINFGSLKK